MLLFSPKISGPGHCWLWDQGLWPLLSSFLCSVLCRAAFSGHAQLSYPLSPFAAPRGLGDKLPPVLVEKGQGTVLHACPPPMSTAGLEFTCLRFIEHGLCTHALATPACRHLAARNSGILHLSKRVRLMQSPSSSPGLVTCRLGLYKEALSFYRLQGAGSLGAAEFCFLQPPYVPSVTLRVRLSLKSWQGLGVCAVLSVSGTQFSWPLVPLLGIS